MVVIVSRLLLNTRCDLQLFTSSNALICRNYQSLGGEIDTIRRFLFKFYQSLPAIHENNFLIIQFIYNNFSKAHSDIISRKHTQICLHNFIQNLKL